MRKMVAAVMLAVFACCSAAVIASELQQNPYGQSTVPDLLVRQTVYDEQQHKLAQWYNLNLTSQWQEPGFEEAYWDILDLQGSAMGYVTIPSQGIRVPICHGAGEKNTAGHIRTTAFPIGGLGTHSALTGDFSLEEADCFYIHILGQVRPYRVTETVTLRNGEVTFPVQTDAELCTLVRTGPEGTVQLMRGSYWEDAPSEETVQVETAADSDGWLIAACIVLALGILLVPFMMWCRGK